MPLAGRFCLWFAAWSLNLILGLCSAFATQICEEVFTLQRISDTKGYAPPPPGAQKGIYEEARISWQKPRLDKTPKITR